MKQGLCGSHAIARRAHPKGVWWHAVQGLAGSTRGARGDSGRRAEAVRDVEMGEGHRSCKRSAMTHVTYKLM